MDSAELELQLEVWKDLAISKQMLIGAAAEALGIRSDCSMSDIKEAFEKATQKALDADAAVARAKEEAGKAVVEMQAKVKQSDLAHAKAMDDAEVAHEAKLEAEHRVNAGREANSGLLKKAKLEIAAKDKSLKQIKKILHDSPENVIKKLKALKKEKMDEGNLRKKAEEDARKQRKDKQKAEQEFKDLEASLAQAAKLVENIKELKKFSESQYDQLKEFVKDKSCLEKTPALDDDLMDSIEKLATKDEKPSKDDSKSGSAKAGKKSASKKKTARKRKK